MYYEKPLPFYMTYPYPDIYSTERSIDYDMQKMKSYYPKTSARIQRNVEDACDRMEYEGSFLYDEYPDRLMMGRMCDHIYEQVKQEDKSEMQSQAIPDAALKELVQVLFYNELYHRRCRRRRCRGF